MKIGIFGGTIDSGTIDQIVDEARSVEVDGFSSYWTSNIFGHESLTALAVVGREVPRIEIGVGVVPTYPRHPVMLAQQGHTVNAASRGRFCLGIGLSHKIVIEGVFGMSFDRPVRHMREYLKVLMPLVESGVVSFQGEVYSSSANLSIKEARKYPVVVAALGEQMLKVAGTLADGTFTWCTGPKTLGALTIPTINDAAQRANRQAPRVIAALPVCVTKDVKGAATRIGSGLAMYGQLPSYRAMLDYEGVAGPAEIAVLGTESEVTQRISDLAGIGVTDFAAVESGGNPDETLATRQTLRSLL